MLLLVRHVGERIIIRDNGREWFFEITRIDRGAVKIAFNAPPEVVILREEVAEREARSAACSMLPQFKEDSIDITGGIESSEYVRRLRGG